MSRAPQPPGNRRHARQELVLKVEFDDAEGFRSNFLSDLSEGGVRINTALEVGQHILLNISFLGFVAPVQIAAIVQWSQPATDPEGAASGLAFVNPTPEARAWLSEVLEASSQMVALPEEASRVILLEAQAFLREVYGQEVRNWAELRDEEALELVAVDNPGAWFDEVTRRPAMLGIIDIDELGEEAVPLYRRTRANDVSAELPIIVIGSRPEPFLQIADDLLLSLRKPLKFGALMNTVRMLARDPLATVIRSRDRSDD